jgi:NADH-dependent peroxiredoxin subunit F
MLDANLQVQLRAYLERLQAPVELLASLDERPASGELRGLLEAIVALSPRLSLRLDGQAVRRPSFEIRAQGAHSGVSFAAVPLGHEFSSLVLALLQAGGVAPKIDDETVQRIQGLEGDYAFETWMSLSCHNCPDVVQALNAMAVLNPRIRHTAIDGALFQKEVEQRQIMAVPTVLLNGEVFASGRMDVAEIVAKLDVNSAALDARKLAAKPVFDMLIVGGGPAGAAAAVYAARKGIATGIVTEKVGGQTLDTLGIENFVSVLQTQGPKFAAALEAHAKAYDVDIMSGQQVRGLDAEPAASGHAPLLQVQLANGAALRARSIVLATGARWRTINVPGEAEYKNKGVAYCPHCDGPLFKGKRVAVIGGGNSGVEAAIDLAGIVQHVSLLEFAGELKADAVLVAKLRSLPNVSVHLNAQTNEIVGDGQKVSALRWTDRLSGAAHEEALAGVFVQIGLVPNTEWLRGVVELSRYGEIVVDARGATSLPGVYAAGDATTVPFKQIVIAAGDGAKAALAAFEHLVRNAPAAA